MYFQLFAADMRSRSSKAGCSDSAQ